MKRKLDLKTNLIFSIISQLVIFVSPLIVAPYISRVLGPSGVGQYSYAYSYAFYFSALISFGFSSTGINLIALNKDDKEKYSVVFWTIETEKLISFVFFSAIYVLLLVFTGFGNNVDLKIGLSLLLVLFSNVLDISFLFQGLENFRIVSFGNMLVNLLYVISIFCFVKTENDVAIYTLLKSSINLLLFLGLWPFTAKKICRYRFGSDEALLILKRSAYFFLPTILMQIGNQIDQSFIGAFCSLEEVGYYQNAMKFPSLVSSLIYAISPVMLSRISILIKEKEEEKAREKITKALNLAFLLVVPACSGLYFIGRYLIPLYFGEQFVSSINVMYILLPTTITSPLNSILINAFFYPYGKTKIVTMSLTLSMVFNILVTFLLTYWFKLGAIGAAVGSLIADILLFASLLLFSRKGISFTLLFSDLWRIVLSGAVMILGLFGVDLILFSTLIGRIVVVCLSGAVLYSFICLVTREKLFMQVIIGFKDKICKKDRL